VPKIEIDAEPPIFFDDKFDFRRRYPIRSNAPKLAQDDGFNAEVKWYDLLQTMNFAPIKSMGCWETQVATKNIAVNAIDFLEDELLARLEMIKQQRQRLIEAARQRMKVEALPAEKQVSFEVGQVRCTFFFDTRDIV
jgi:hypothetical protein